MPTVMAEGIPTTSSNPNGAEPERNQAWLVFKYIYDIPSTVRKSIANILDRSNKWYELGTKQMGFTAVEMDVSIQIVVQDQDFLTDTVLFCRTKRI